MKLTTMAVKLETTEGDELYFYLRDIIDLKIENNSYLIKAKHSSREWDEISEVDFKRLNKAWESFKSETKNKTL